MPTFEEFVQTELPLRPFVGSDGMAGQVLMRSMNPQAVRELIWGTVEGVGPPPTELSLEAGEDLTAGTPVKVNANKFYAASHATDPHVIGIVKTGVVAAQSVNVVTSGALTLSDLTPGSPYFLGVGVLTSTAPSSGYVVRLGTAVTSSVLLVNVEEPIYLS